MSDQWMEEMYLVGASGSLDRARRFLQKYPEMLNEYNHYTPLDCALIRGHTKIVHMLVAVGAPLEDREPNELDEFLKAHPAPSWGTGEVRGKEDQTWSWMPSFVLKLLQLGTLKKVSTDEIKHLLHEGKLPCGWTHDLAWRRISILTEEQRTLTDSYQKEHKRLNEEEQRLTDQLQQVQSELQIVQQQKIQVALDLQEHARRVSGAGNLDELSAFAQRVEPIEEALMSALESELEKKHPKLSALTESLSAQPKLSLFLNGMGTPSTAIHATRELTSITFKRQTKNNLEFVERYGSQVSRDMMKDLLYCGEILRDCDPPMIDHEDKCPVCLNRTPEELIHYLRERDIALDSDTIRKNHINGRRALFSRAKEFPDAEAARSGLDLLRDIHEESM